MKKYIKPEFEVTKLNLEDIITTSGEIIEVAENPTSTVGGLTAVSYGTKDISIFD